MSAGSARRALTACLAAGLLACGASPSPPPDSFHRLSLAPPAARARPLLAGVVEVERLDAVDALRGRAQAWVRADRPELLRHASYDFWVDPPPVLLRDALIDYLRDGGIAERVVRTEDRDEPVWIVSGRILRFERVRGGADGATVDLELSLRRRAERAPIVRGRYEASEPASSDSAAASADAMGRALDAAFSAFVAEIAAALGP